jgi:exosome complex RNA-binding protein Rrp42 (RNase PH superfamily)
MSLIEELIRKEQRIDKRGLTEERVKKIKKINNSYILQAKDSFVSFTYQILTTKPHPERPHEGLLSLYYHSTEKNKKEDKRINKLINKVFVRSKCVDLEALCIKYSEVVYSVNVEIKSIGYTSASFIIDATSYVLANISLFPVEGFSTNPSISLSFAPSCYFFVNIEDRIIADPLKCEEEKCKWKCLVVMYEGGVNVYRKEWRGV